MDVALGINICVLGEVQLSDNTWSDVTPVLISKCFYKAKLFDELPSDIDEDNLSSIIRMGRQN